MSQWQDGPEYGRVQHPLMWVQKLLDWSLNCGRPVAGIRLRVHWSLLILPLISASYFLPGISFLQFTMLVLMFVVILYGSVYLHELGHALTALRLGYPVRDIKLYMMGGLATMSYAPTNANHDFAIIAFGPMVNFILVGFAALFTQLILPFAGMDWGHVYLLDFYMLGPKGFFETLFWWNLGLGVFNLTPMFPLDGGGMARALFSMKYHPNVVTLRVAWFGMWIVAPIMIILAFVNIFTGGRGSWLLLLIGIAGIQASLWERMRARHMPVYSNEPPPNALSPWQSAWDEDPGYGAVPYGGWAGEKSSGTTTEKKKSRSERKAEERARKDAEKAAADKLKVEELLDKISREGITALSNREKEFLKNASKRYQ